MDEYGKPLNSKITPIAMEVISIISNPYLINHVL